MPDFASLIGAIWPPGAPGRKSDRGRVVLVVLVMGVLLVSRRDAIRKSLSILNILFSCCGLRAVGCKAKNPILTKPPASEY